MFPQGQPGADVEDGIETSWESLGQPRGAVERPGRGLEL